MINVNENTLPQVYELMILFENSFINNRDELILIPETNLYFNVKNVKSAVDFYKKIISWCSRAACKTTPYHQQWKNIEYQDRVRSILNKYLCVEFSQNDWMLIYTYLGNGIHDDLCEKFILSNFDLDIIKEYERNKDKKELL